MDLSNELELKDLRNKRDKCPTPLIVNQRHAETILEYIKTNYPTLFNSTVKTECVGKMCYVSDTINFDDELNHDDFINGLMEWDIRKFTVDSISTSKEYPFITDGGVWVYAIPCDKVKLTIGDNNE